MTGGSGLNHRKYGVYWKPTAWALEYVPGRFFYCISRKANAKNERGSMPPRLYY